MRNIGDVSGVELEELSIRGDSIDFSVIVDGANVGTVSFMKYYEPALKAIEPYMALWAGAMLCVIDRPHATMRCVDRGDETHEIHSLEGLWVVEGELNVDLFDPKNETILATYHHDEVITSSSLADGLVYIQDFAGATVILDPRRLFQVVGRESTREESDNGSN
jgi:hypothetical protein